MPNRFGIPEDIELRLRRIFKNCAYCGLRLKGRGSRSDYRKMPTIEHLNRNGPFHWVDNLKEEHLVIACGECNSSRGKKLLYAWFESSYCVRKKIHKTSVAARVRKYLRTKLSRI